MSHTVVTVFRREKSLNGHSLDTLKSAIQKYARRSELQKLLWSLFEFDTLLTGEFNKDTVRIRTNLHHRMLIIYLEDIGPPGMIYTQYMNNLFSTLKSCRNYTETQDMTTKMYSVYKQYEIKEYVKWAWICAHSVKSRESDHYRVYYSRIQQKEPDALLSSENIDQVVSVDKESSTVKYFCEQLFLNLKERNINALYWAYKIINSKINGTYFKKKKPEYLVFWILSKIQGVLYLDVYMNWFEILKLNSECFLCWSNLIINHCKPLDSVIIARDRGSIVGFDPSKVQSTDRPEAQNSSLECAKFPTEEIIDKLAASYELNYSTKLKFDEYVYDMHTYIGKLRKRSYTYFADVSSLVTNEAPNVNLEIKDVYNNFLISHDGPGAYTV